MAERLRRKRVSDIRGLSRSSTNGNITKKFLRRDTARFQQQELIKENAREFDKIFTDLEQFGTIQNAIKNYNEIPLNIRNSMSFNLDKLKSSQQERINTLENRIKARKKQIERSQERERELKDRGRDSSADRERAREDGYRAEVRQLEEYKKELQKGNIINPQQIISFAKDVGRNEERRQRAKDRERKARREQSKNILDQVKEGAGNVTRISYDRQGNISSIVVDGQRVSTSGLPKIKKNEIQLTAVRNANQRTRQKTFEKVADENLTIGELREQGFNMGEINQIGQIQIAKDLQKQQEQGKKLNKTQLSMLGFNEKQIEAIRGDGGTTNRELIEAGLNLREIAQIGQQIQTDKIVNQIKQQREQAVKNIVQESLGRLPVINQKLVENEINKKYGKTLYKEFLKERRNKTFSQLKDKFGVIKSNAINGFLKLNEGKKVNDQELKAMVREGFTFNPVAYFKNLQERKKAGERNPFTSDVKQRTRVVQGISASVWDLFNFVFGVKGVTADSTGISRDGIVAWTFRNSLGNRVVKDTARVLSGTQFKTIRNDIVKDIRRNKNSFKGVSKGVVDVTTFVKNNPEIALIGLSTALASGGITAIGTGEKARQKFLEDPEYNTGYLLGWLFPSTTIKLGGRALTGVRNINSQLSKVAFSQKEIKSLQQQIKELEKLPNKTREEKQALKNLRALSTAQSNLIKSSNDLTQSITKVEKGVKGKELNKELPKIKKQENKVQEQIKDYNKKKKKIKGVKLRDETIAKNLNKLFKDDSVKVKVKKLNPLQEIKKAGNNPKVLITILEENINAKNFKALRRSVENITGKRVLIRDSKKPIYKVSGEKITPKNVKEIKLVDKKKVQQLGKDKKVKKVRIENNTLKREISKKERRELEKEAKQVELDIIQGRVQPETIVKVNKNSNAFFNDKKARSTLTMSIRKGYRKYKTSFQKFRKDKQKYVNDTKKITSQRIRENNKRVRQGKKPLDLPKTEKEKLKNFSKTKKEIVQKQKELQKLRSQLQKLLSAVKLTRGLSSILKNIQLQRQQLKSLQKQLEKLETPIKEVLTPKVPRIKKVPKKTPSIKKVPKKTPKKVPKPIRKPRIKRTPKKVPKPIRKPIIKKTPPKVPRLPSLPEIKKRLPKRTREKRSIRNVNLGELTLSFTDPKDKKIKRVKIKTGLPLLEAKQLGIDLTDELILGSFQVKRYNTKELLPSVSSNQKLNKFRSKRSQSKRVQELVEKRNFRLDKPLEKNTIVSSKLKNVLEDRIKQIKKILLENARKSKLKSTEKDKVIKNVKKNIPKIEIKVIGSISKGKKSSKTSSKTIKGKKGVKKASKGKIKSKKVKKTKKTKTNAKTNIKTNAKKKNN